MNLDSPNLRNVDPPDGPDYLAGAVLDGLARPIGGRKSWTFFRTTLRAVLSFGLLPIIELPQRFREFVTMEQQQLWHLAEWLRLNSKHPETLRLRKQAEALAPRSDLPLMAWLATGFVGVIFFTQLRTLADSIGYSGHWFSALLDSTWLFSHGATRNLAPMLARKLFMVWSVGLGVAYFCYWLQIRGHEREVGRFVKRFNRIAATHEIEAVTFEPARTLMRPAWIAGGVAFGIAGAWWGIPMMVGAAWHRVYVTRVSVATRAALAMRLRAMLLRQRPSMQVPVPVLLRRSCKNEQCRASVPQHARFCPRCGKRLSEPLHLLA